MVQERGMTMKKSVRLATLAAMAALAAAPATAAADPWPVEGGNQFNHRYSSNGGPTGSRAAYELKEVWKRTWDAPAVGTPIIGQEGGVYVGSTDGTVRAFVAKTGAQYWSQFIGGPQLGSMAKVGKTVYAVANVPNSPRLVALDWFTGDIKFSTPLHNQRDADVCGGLNYSSTLNAIIVGVGACQAERENRATRTRGSIVAVEATTGVMLWKTDTVPPGFNGGGVESTPLVWDGGAKVWATTGHAYTGVAAPTTDSILQLDLISGQITGAFQATSDDVSNNGALELQKRAGFTAPPVGFATRTGKAYIGAGAEDGAFYLVDALSMALTSKTQMTAGNGDPFGISASSAWDGRQVFGVTKTPATYFALDPMAGSVNWAFPGSDVLHSGPVTVADNAVWSTSTTGFLDAHYRYAPGHILGRTPLGRPSTGGIAPYRNQLFVTIGAPELPGANTGTGSGGLVVLK